MSKAVENNSHFWTKDETMCLQTSYRSRTACQLKLFVGAVGIRVRDSIKEPCMQLDESFTKIGKETPGGILSTGHVILFLEVGGMVDGW